MAVKGRPAATPMRPHSFHSRTHPLFILREAGPWAGKSPGGSERNFGHVTETCQTSRPFRPAHFSRAATLSRLRLALSLSLSPRPLLPGRPELPDGRRRRRRRRRTGSISSSSSIEATEVEVGDGVDDEDRSRTKKSEARNRNRRVQDFKPQVSLVTSSNP